MSKIKNICVHEFPLRQTTVDLYVLCVLTRKRDGCPNTYSRLPNVTTKRKEPHACTIGSNIESNKPHAFPGLYSSNALWGTVRNCYRERPTLKNDPPYHSSKLWYIGGILAKEASLQLKLASNTEQINLGVAKLQG